jgi:MFS transporter, FSR family, fosmidomycin resistance protein
MPHMIRKPGILGGTTLAVFMTLVHTVNDAMTAILGALLPTLQVRFDAGPTALALMIAVFWIASSVTQPVFGALGEDVGLRLIGCVGVLMASTFLSLIGVASELWLVFVLLVIGGLGSAAPHPIGTTITGSQATNATLGPFATRRTTLTRRLSPKASATSHLLSANGY